MKGTKSLLLLKMWKAEVRLVMPPYTYNHIHTVHLSIYILNNAGTGHSQFKTLRYCPFEAEQQETKKQWHAKVKGKWLDRLRAETAVVDVNAPHQVEKAAIEEPAVV